MTDLSRDVSDCLMNIADSDDLGVATMCLKSLLFCTLNIDEDCKRNYRLFDTLISDEGLKTNNYNVENEY